MLFASAIRSIPYPLLYLHRLQRIGKPTNAIRLGHSFYSSFAVVSPQTTTDWETNECYSSRPFVLFLIRCCISTDYNELGNQRMLFATAIRSILHSLLYLHRLQRIGKPTNAIRLGHSFHSISAVVSPQTATNWETNECCCLQPFVLFFIRRCISTDYNELGNQRRNAIRLGHSFYSLFAVVSLQTTTNWETNEFCCLQPFVPFLIRCCISTDYNELGNQRMLFVSAIRFIPHSPLYLHRLQRTGKPTNAILLGHSFHPDSLSCPLEPV